MSNLDEVRRLLREAQAELDPARQDLPIHPIVPIAIASNRVRDALYLLNRTDPEPTTGTSWKARRCEMQPDGTYR